MTMSQEWLPSGRREKSWCRKYSEWRWLRSEETMSQWKRMLRFWKFRRLMVEGWLNDDHETTAMRWYQLLLLLLLFFYTQTSSGTDRFSVCSRECPKDPDPGFSCWKDSMRLRRKMMIFLLQLRTKFLSEGSMRESNIIRASLSEFLFLLSLSGSLLFFHFLLSIGPSVGKRRTLHAGKLMTRIFENGEAGDSIQANVTLAEFRDVLNSSSSSRLLSNPFFRVSRVMVPHYPTSQNVEFLFFLACSHSSPCHPIDTRKREDFGKDGNDYDDDDDDDAADDQESGCWMWGRDGWWWNDDVDGIKCTMRCWITDSAAAWRISRGGNFSSSQSGSSISSSLIQLNSMLPPPPPPPPPPLILAVRMVHAFYYNGKRVLDDDGALPCSSSTLLSLSSLKFGGFSLRPQLPNCCLFGTTRWLLLFLLFFQACLP